MVKALDCGIVGSEFGLQSRYYFHFRTNTLGKSMNAQLLQAMGQIVPLLVFLENGFGIKYTKKVDMTTNNKTLESLKNESKQ